MENYEAILKDVSEKTGVAVKTILSNNRSDKTVTARQKAAMQMRNTGMTLVDIGAALNRDHSAITHLLNNRKGDNVRNVKTKRKGFIGDLISERNRLMEKVNAINRVIETYDRH